MATKKSTKSKIASGINKEPVRLREKVLANGNVSLYLDVYRNGKRKKEYLKLYLTQLSQVNFPRSNSAYSCTNIACRCEFSQTASRISSL